MRTRRCHLPVWAGLACLLSSFMFVGGSSPMDVGVGALSPDGSLYQLEYACAAAARGALVVGVEAAGSVVLVCARSDASPLPAAKRDSSTEDEKHASTNEKTPEGNHDGSNGGVPAAWSTLMQGSSNRAYSCSSRKLVPLAPTLGCAASGLLPDAGVLIQAARAAVANHDFVYGAAPSVEAAARACGDAALSFSRHPRLASEGDPPLELGRPLAVQLLVAGCDRTRRHYANPANTVQSSNSGKTSTGRATCDGSSSSSDSSDNAHRDSRDDESATNPLPPPSPLQPPPPAGALYSVAPTGAVSRWHAKAIGSGAKEADLFLGRWLQRRAQAWEDGGAMAAATTSVGSSGSNTRQSSSVQEELSFNQPAQSTSIPDEPAGSKSQQENEANMDVASIEEAAASAAARLRMGLPPPSECEACHAAIAAVLSHLEEQSSVDDGDVSGIEGGNGASKPAVDTGAADTGEASAAALRGFLPKLTAVDVARVEVAVARPSGFQLLPQSEIVALLKLND